MKHKPKYQFLRWLVITCIVGLGLFFVFFSSGPGEKIIRRILEGQAQKFLNAAVKIEKFETNLVSSITIKNIYIYPENKDTNKSLLEIGNIRVTYTLWGLLRQKPRVKKITLDGIKVSILRDETGAYALPFLFKQADSKNAVEKKSSMPIRIKNVDLKNISIDYQDAKSASGLSLKNISCLINNSGEDEYNYNIKIPAGWINYQNRKVPLTNAEISGIWNFDEINLKQLKCGIFDGTIQSEGKIKIKELIAEKLFVNMDNLNLPSIGKIIYDDKFPYEGKLSGKITASGPLLNPENLDLLANMVINEVQYKSETVSDLYTTVRIYDKLCNFMLQQGNSKISADLEIKEKKISGNFESAILDLEPLAGLFNIKELKGKLNAVGEIEGEINSPKIKAKILGEDIKYQYFPIDKLKGDIVFERGNLRFYDTYLEGGIKKINTVQPPFNIEGIEGGFFYTLNINGLLDNLSGNLILKLEQPGYNNYRYDDGYLKAAFKDGELLLQKFQLTKDRMSMNVSGAYVIKSGNGKLNIKLVDAEAKEIGATSMVFSYDNKNNYYFLKMKEEGLDLNTLNVFIPSMPEVGGLLKYSLDFSGNLETPLINMDFRIDKPSYQTEFDFIEGNIIVKNEQLQIKNFKLADKNNTYSLIEGKINLEKGSNKRYFISENSELDIEVKSSGLDLSFISSLFGEKKKIAGIAAYDLILKGSMKRPYLKGNLSIQNGFLQLGPDATQIEQITCEVNVDRAQINIDKLKGVIKQTPFNIYGQIKTNSWEKYDIDTVVSITDFKAISVKGMISKKAIELNAKINKFDISLLQPFFSEIKQLSGILNTDIAIKGTMENPVLYGYIKGDGLNVYFKRINEAIQDGVIRVVCDGNQVNVEKITAKVNEGYFLITGSFAHRSGLLEKISLNTEVENIKISQPKTALIFIKSAHFKYENKDEYYFFSGDVDLGDTRLLVDFKPQVFITKRQVYQTAAKKTPSIFEKTKMDVRVKGNKNLWLSNNLGRVRFDADVVLIGSIEKPVITGRVNVEEGYILYLDRKFYIKQGVFDFIDYSKINPIINIIAESKIKSYYEMAGELYVIVLSLQGPLEEIKIELTSNPPLEKADIIALLTFGATRTQLTGRGVTGKEGDVGDVLKERLETLSSKFISGYIAGAVGNFLSLDDISIEGNLFQYQGMDPPRLKAIKKISERTEVTYTTTVGHINEQSIKLGYILSKYFLLENQINRQGRSNIGLKYRLRMR